MGLLPDQYDKYLRFFKFMFKYWNSDVFSFPEEQVPESGDENVSNEFDHTPEELTEDLKKMRPLFTGVGFYDFSKKKTISAAELQRQLEHPKYDTVWRLTHKIRGAMGKCNALYQLEGAIEYDEGCFVKATSEKVKLTRGKG